LTLSNEEIVELVQRYENESKAIRNEALKLTWFMRGGVSYSEAMTLSGEERKIIAKIIKENVENTEKSGLPLI